MVGVPRSQSPQGHGKIVFHKTGPCCQEGWGPCLLDWMISVRQLPYLVTIISSKSYTRAQITVKTQCMMAV